MAPNRLEKTLEYALLGSVFLLLVLFLFAKISDSDFWFHLRTGQYICTEWKIPHHDLFSSTAPQHTWIDSHWLFQAVLFLAFKALGTNGAIFLQMGVVLVLFWVFFRLGGRQTGGLALSFCLFLAIMTMNERFLVRPEMFTFLFLGLYFYVLDLYQTRRKDYLFLLPVMQLIWVNMHGLFVLGIFLVFGMAAGGWLNRGARRIFPGLKNTVLENRQVFKLLVIGLIMTGCSFLNPYGLRGGAYPFLLFSEIGKQASEFMQGINELASPFSGRFQNEIVIYYLLLIGLSAASFVLNFKRLDFFRLIVWIGFLYLSLPARRNIALLAVIVTPIMLRNLEGCGETLSGLPARQKKWLRSFRWLRGTASVALLFFIIIYAAEVTSDRYFLKVQKVPLFGLGVAEAVFPERAVDFLIKIDLPGNVFNEPSYGGYFIWRCGPERKVFIDGRWEVYGDAFLRTYITMLSSQQWQEFLDSYRVNYALISNTENPQLFKKFFESHNWAPIYCDEIATIFLRNLPENQGLRERYQVDLQTLEAGKISASTQEMYLRDAGEHKKKVLSAYFHYMRGNFFVVTGQYDKGIQELETCLDIYPDIPLSYVYGVLGQAYDFQGRDDDAIRQYKKALKLEDDAEVHNNLGVAYIHKGLNRDAVREFRRALRRDRRNGIYSDNLRRALSRSGGQGTPWR